MAFSNLTILLHFLCCVPSRGNIQFLLEWRWSIYFGSSHAPKKGGQSCLTQCHQPCSPLSKCHWTTVALALRWLDWKLYICICVLGSTSRFPRNGNSFSRKLRLRWPLDPSEIGIPLFWPRAINFFEGPEVANSSKIGLYLKFRQLYTPGLDKTWGPRLFPVLIPYLSRTKPVFSKFGKNTVFWKPVFNP